MQPARVLIVDDSSLVRRTLASLVDEDESFEVVGMAANGQIGLRMVKSKNPDIVILDVEMPGMSGIEVLRVLTLEHPDVSVVMFSAHSDAGASVTMDALMSGASDYVSKPSKTRGLDDARNRIRVELLPKLRGLIKTRFTTAPPPPAPHAPPIAAPAAARPPLRPQNAADAGTPIPRVKRLGRPADLVAVGSSTGGPEALATVLSSIEEPLPVPMVITQHMPAVFTRALAARLSDRTGHNVKEAAGGEVLCPGDVYIAPGGQHLLVQPQSNNLVLTLHDGPPENSCRPAVDVMLRSIASLPGCSALVVILTGMGRDGLNGCRSLKRRGAEILAQDEATSVVWGMPGYVVREGIADCALPIDRIGAAIIERTLRGGAHKRPAIGAIA